MGAHWVADRQTGPLLLRYGTESQRRRFLPMIAAGEMYFAIGMSEPDAGSDLAAVRTRARRVPGGWQVNGSKTWTSGAHLSHFMVTLCRTSTEDDRHVGLTQLIIDLRAPGVSISPIRYMTGEHHWNTVTLTDVFVQEALLLGAVGEGWAQVTSELTYERSGPDRYTTLLPLLASVIDALRSSAIEDAGAEVIGDLYAQLWTLRQMSLAVASELERGGAPSTAAALVKDMGTRFEGQIVDAARKLLPPSIRTSDEFEDLLDYAVLARPSFTLRGGTNEILRLVIARALLPT